MLSFFLSSLSHTIFLSPSFLSRFLFSLVSPFSSSSLSLISLFFLSSLSPLSHLSPLSKTLEAQVSSSPNKFHHLTKTKPSKINKKKFTSIAKNQKKNTQTQHLAHPLPFLFLFFHPCKQKNTIQTSINISYIPNQWHNIS